MLSKHISFCFRSSSRFRVLAAFALALWIAGLLLAQTVRREFLTDISGAYAEGGHCYILQLNPGAGLKAGTSDYLGYSFLTLYENGKALGPGHSSHAEILKKGGGLYTHWRNHVFFSSSDNTNPLTNQRRYELRSLSTPSPWLLWPSLALWILVAWPWLSAPVPDCRPGSG